MVVALLAHDHVLGLFGLIGNSDSESQTMKVEERARRRVQEESLILLGSDQAVESSA